LFYLCCTYIISVEKKKIKLITNWFTRISILILVFTVNTTCIRFDKIYTGKIRDLDEIKKSGKLIAVTDNSSINYFIYRGEPMGYQYDMLQELANHLGVKIELIISRNLGEAMEILDKGECDLIAINLTISSDRKKGMAFTKPFMQTRQVLVQRKPNNWQSLTSEELDDALIRNPIQLASRNAAVYVQKGSSYTRRMHNLAEEIGDSINIIDVPKDAETLINMVAEGKIDYTVCDENTAIVCQSIHSNIDVSTPVSFPQNLAWALNLKSPALLNITNEWLRSYTRSTDYAIMYDKYFHSQRTSYILNSDLNAFKTGRISEYDQLIRRYSKKTNWDWRLVASIIYQESRFDPHARSWSGAYGLMQLMPETATRFGADSAASPAESIRAGMEMLVYLDQRYSKIIDDSEQRIKFILAAYNLGVGHVDDAQRLAAKNGKNPNIWDNNVEVYMKQTTNPLIYRDPVVEFGYCRGDLALNYVNEILDRYQHYKNVASQK
jgi:membrane-bound lytic murein transglycosylase F